MASIEVPRDRRSTWQGAGEYTLRWRNRVDPETGGIKQRKLKRQFESRKEAQALCGIIDAELKINAFWWPSEWRRGEARGAAEEVAVVRVIAAYCRARGQKGNADHTVKKDQEIAHLQKVVDAARVVCETGRPIDMVMNIGLLAKALGELG